jgi:hypothetical protein
MYRREEIDKIIKSGASFIEKVQRKDGSWYVQNELLRFMRELYYDC